MAMYIWFVRARTSKSMPRTRSIIRVLVVGATCSTSSQTGPAFCLTLFCLGCLTVLLVHFALPCWCQSLQCVAINPQHQVDRTIHIMRCYAGNWDLPRGQETGSTEGHYHRVRQATRCAALRQNSLLHCCAPCCEGESHPPHRGSVSGVVPWLALNGCHRFCRC